MSDAPTEDARTEHDAGHVVTQADREMARAVDALAD
jgi:pterin-4a-carbinolamine dehydratase